MLNYLKMPALFLPLLTVVVAGNNVFAQTNNESGQSAATSGQNSAQSNQAQNPTPRQAPRGQDVNAELAEKSKKLTLQDYFDKTVRYTDKVPTNFPVRSYASNVTKTEFVHSTEGEPAASLTIITRDKPLDVFRWYESALRGNNWKVMVPTSQAMQKLRVNLNFYFLNAEKGPHRLEVYCIENKADSGTRISISWRFER